MDQYSEEKRACENSNALHEVLKVLAESDQERDLVEEDMSTMKISLGNDHESNSCQPKSKL